MNGKLRDCPQCGKETLQYELDKRMIDAGTGLNVAQVAELAELRLCVWFCVKCYKTHNVLWQPDAQRVDLRDLIKRTGGGAR